MVCLQASISPKEKKNSSLENFLSKKRKFNDGDRDGKELEDTSTLKDSKLTKTNEKSNIDLYEDTRLPLEWQQCLDIKSGQIHFYNTRTHTRTSKDPRLSPKAPSSRLTIDLELNLACNSQGHNDEKQQRKTLEISGLGNSIDVDKQEMVATVCMHCHMLVMMCKSTLSCPNCKFVHPNHKNFKGCATHSNSSLNILSCKD